MASVSDYSIIICTDFLLRSIETAKKRLRNIMSLDAAAEDERSDCKLKNKNLPDFLLDIANYEAPELVQYSLLLLHRFYSTESSIFQKALESRLLKANDSIALYNKILNGKDIDINGRKMPPIAELAESCWLSTDEIGYEPHQINQSIILSFGN